MAKRILSRREYDVRFLDIPGPVQKAKLEDRINELIHQVYPGNNERYSHFTRVLFKERYITVIVKKEIIERYSGDKLYIPALILPEIIKKTGKKLITSLVIWSGAIGELISFTPEGIPLASRIVESPPQKPDILWVFVSSPDKEFKIPSGSLVFSKPISPSKGRIFCKKESSGILKPINIVLGSLLFLILLLTGLSLLSNIQKENIQNLRVRQNLNQSAAIEKQQLESEIRALEKNLEEIIKDESPYLLLSSLYQASDPSFRIRRISIQKGAFTLEGIDDNPINFSGSLSESMNFSNINILRTQEIDETYFFSLKGEFNE